MKRLNKKTIKIPKQIDIKEIPVDQDTSEYEKLCKSSCVGINISMFLENLSFKNFVKKIKTFFSLVLLKNMIKSLQKKITKKLSSFKK